MIAIIVDLDELLFSVAAAIVAGIAVTVVVSMAIWGTTRYVDYHDEGRGRAAIGALAVGIVALLLTAVIVLGGILLMVKG